MPMRCEIVSQDRIVFEGDADIVNLPAADGMMGILPNHAPVLTVIRYGVVEVRHEKEQYFFTIAGGVAEVMPDVVVVLADAAENVEEIDLKRAEDARQKAEELLKSGIGDDADRYLAIQAALRRSTLRLDAVQRYQKAQRLKNRN